MVQCFVLLGVRCTNLHLVNYATKTICARYWVPNEVGGGCKVLSPGQAWDVFATPTWRAATLWAIKDGCGPCDTGPPTGVTQFEITIGGGWGNDYYDLSMLAGFNLGMKVTPSNFDCASQSCLVPSPSACQGFFPGGPDRTNACRYGSSDYNIAFYD